MTPTDAGLIVVAIVVIALIVLGVMFYLTAVKSSKNTSEQLTTLNAASTAQALSIQTLSNTQSTQQDTLSTLWTKTGAQQAAVADLQRSPLLTVLTQGNNNSVSCPAFCNNAKYYGLFNQVPSMETWRGATSIHKRPILGGWCDCVEDPAVPFDSIRIADAFTGEDMVYAGSKMAPSLSPSPSSSPSPSPSPA